MVVRRLLLTLLLAPLLVSLPLQAETRPDELPAATILPLMNWVVLRTHVAVPTLPRVIVSRAEMIAKIGDPQRQSALARALYVPGEVVIDDQFWNGTDIRTQSFLVHELVHHAQLFNGVAYACQKAKESEAYHLQNVWLAEHGQPPAVDEAWIAEMSRCGETATAAR